MLDSVPVEKCSPTQARLTVTFTMISLTDLNMKSTKRETKEKQNMAHHIYYRHEKLVYWKHNVLLCPKQYKYWLLKIKLIKIMPMITKTSESNRLGKVK